MTASSMGKELRQRRQHAGLSLRDLARQVNYDFSYLSQVERGQRPGSPTLAERCDDVLGTNGALVALFEPTPRDREGDADTMRRRTILAALTALATGATTSAALVSAEAARQGMATALGDIPGADEWEAIAAAYARDFYTTAPANLLSELTADLIVLQQTIEAETCERAHRDLRHAAAQLSVVMAMTFASLGQTRTARRWWRTARRAADQANDPEIQAWTRKWEVVNGLYERRPISELLALADESLAIAGTRTGSGTTGTLAGKAQALSTLRDADSARATLRQLATACERLPSSVVDDDCSMFGWPEYRLRYTESYVYTNLGDTTAAYAAQERALALYPPELARERAQLQLHRARCLVIDGHLDDGLAYGTQILDNLDATYHNELLYEMGRAIITAVPAAERRRPTLADFRHRLRSPGQHLIVEPPRGERQSQPHMSDQSKPM
ncbi:MAG: helix-turn-helix transcriptional regulator [Micromonosporaceae bacterium]|nr:helix-turn-helix transcriptional regulator [Micromonosporaceae bacterium]